jgi:hypothetical protein
MGNEYVQVMQLSLTILCYVASRLGTQKNVRKCKVYIMEKEDYAQ